MSEPDQVLVDRAKLIAIVAELGSLQSQLTALSTEVAALLTDAPSTPDQQVSVIAAVPLAAKPPDDNPPIVRAAEPGQGEIRQAIHFKQMPLVLRHGGAPLRLPTNGIDLQSGRYLLEIDAKAASDFAKKAPDSQRLSRVHLTKQRGSTERSLGLLTGYREDQLDESRWGVVVSATDDQELLMALTPLIRWRAAQQGISLNEEHLRFQRGQPCGAWYYKTVGSEDEHRKRWGELPPVFLYRRDHGEDMPVNQWLARYGVAQGPVDPPRGVPFYLMLAARPGPLFEADQAFIPYNFQYELDLFWGVGRLCFTDSNGTHDYVAYTTYAERVVAFEQRQDAAASLRKEIVYFGTDHALDDATHASATELIAPLYYAHGENKQSGAGRLEYERRLFLGDGTAVDYAGRRLEPLGKADRTILERVLRGADGGRPPAILFTATHGAGLLDASASTMLEQQGALICQGWQGPDHAPAMDDVLAGEHLTRDLNLDGMIAVLFACYGVGCPQYDEFVFQDGERPAVAPFPFVARLPQRLLLSGALAVLGHVERAWTYAFRGEGNATAQSQAFEDVLGRIAGGKRLGFATDQFNTVQGARSVTLTQMLEDIKFGREVEPLDLAMLWAARNDARNYALLGDPAVRLPFGAGSPYRA